MRKGSVTPNLSQSFANSMDKYQNFGKGFRSIGGGGSSQFPETPLVISEDEADLDNSLRNTEARLRYAGQSLPQAKRGNWLTSALDALDRPRNAIATAIMDVGRNEGTFWQGLQEGFTGQKHTSAGDILEAGGVKNKYARNIGGFLLDAVVLDPLSYFTFGLGKFAKGALTGTKAVGREYAELALREAGHAITTAKDAEKLEKLYKTGKATLGQVADAWKGVDETDNLVADFLKGKTKEYGRGFGVTAPLGNRGTELVSGATMQNAGAAVHDMIGSALGKVPVLGDIGKSTKNMMKTLFNPFYVETLSDDASRFVLETYRRYRGDAALQATKGIDEAIKTAKQAGATKDDLMNVYKVLEDPTGEGLELLSKDKSGAVRKVADYLKGKYADIYGREVGESVLSADNKIENYMHHTPSWEIKKSPLKQSKARSAFKIVNANDMQRVVGGKTVAEANAILEKKTGVANFFEKHALRAYASRVIESNQVLADKKFMDEMLKAFDDSTSRAKYSKAAQKTEGKVLVTPKINGVGLDVIKSAEKGRKSYLIDADIANYINALTNKQVDKGTVTLGRFIDRAMELWKPTATGLNPMYHTRNIVGSALQNVLDLGFKTLDPKIGLAAKKMGIAAARGVDPEGTVKLAGKEWSLKALMDDMSRYGAENGFMMADFGNIERQITRETESHLKSAAAQLVNPINWGKAAGKTIETDARAVNFLAHMDLGATPQQAAAFVKKYHFDYTELTDVEQTVFKRLFPFYTWMRKNIPLQFEELLNQPAKFTIYSKMMEYGSELTETDLQNAPDWLKEQFPVAVDKDKLLALRPPITDLNTGAKDIMGALSPLIKAPIELYMNQSMLTGAPIDRTGDTNLLDVNNPMYEPKEFMGAEMPAKYAYLLNQFGVLRNVDKLADAQTNANTGKMLTTGVVNPISTYDEDVARLNAKYDYGRELQNVIQALGAQGIYVPTMKEQELLAYLPPEAREVVKQNGMSDSMVSVLKTLRAQAKKDIKKGW